MLQRLFVLFTCMLTLFVNAQELPPIYNYNQEIYKGGNQNWMISQDANHHVYVANNEGLLEFDGSRWTLYPTPNETILRSVFCENDRIYSGAYMDFGYWKRNGNGKLVYESLSKKLKIKLLEDEQFWGIISHENWILFQSLQRIYIYDATTEKVEIIDPKSPIFKIYQMANYILFQSEKGIFEIVNGKPELFFDNDLISKQKITSIFETVDKDLILVSQNNGLYIYNSEGIKSLPTDVDSIIKNDLIYSAIKLQNGSIVLGTVSNGLLKISRSGEKMHHITQKNGISNNTVLAMFEDVDQNVWIGLDNGIDCINFKSAIKNYSNKTGELGTVYTSIVFNGKLYIGTNQGLFVRPKGSQDFEFVNGTKGQVWSLFVHDNTLFCGHDAGTFIIYENQSKRIYNQQGTWKFAIYNNEIVQGNYYGLSVLSKKNNEWRFDRKINNYSISSRFFEFSKTGDIIVSHEYKGLLLLKVDSDLTKVNQLVKLDEPKKSKHAGLIKFNEKILYASRHGVYEYLDNTKVFEKSETLSSIFENNEYVTGKMVVDQSNSLWFFTKSYMHYFTASKISNTLKKNSLPIPSSLTNSMPGFENITQISDALFLIGTTNGYYTLQNNIQKKKMHKVSITEILNIDQKNTEQLIDLQHNNPFTFQQNNLTFHFSVPTFDKYITTEYQYILEGFHDHWSKWSPVSSITIENLPPGKYIFKVKANVANMPTENIAEFEFEILKPWYANHWAIGFYILFSIVMAFFINKLYNDYHNKRHQKIIAENNILLELKELESQKEIMKIRNEQLTQDVDKKSKELAVSTMNLMKKDELLQIIKEDLKQTTELNPSKKIKSVISAINSTVSDENTWNVFKDAFDKADNDFIKKIKNAHPALTPNDLRLCAYLRLNLSSKEIAPLLNISVRSVEIKRYRLRKKMDLPHEQSLVDYILSI